MATIFDLNESISHMDSKEALELILDRRTSRRVPKKKKTKKSSGKGAKAKITKNSVSVEDLLNKFSTEQNKNILAKMEAIINAK